MPFYTKEYIDAVVARLTLHEVIEREAGVRFKRLGNRYVGLCPFHKEKTPSFMVFEGKSARYQCFGANCSVNGDVLNFLQHWRNLNFTAAVELAGSIAGLQPANEDTISRTITSSNGNSVNPSRLPWNREPVAADIQLPVPGEYVLVHNPASDMIYWCQPSHVHIYRNSEGMALFLVIRVGRTGGNKYFHQLEWKACDLPEYPTLNSCWTQIEFDPDILRPLYGLQDINSWGRLKGGSILFVEGEKTRDATSGALPMETAGIVTLANLGSVGAIDKTDLQMLVETIQQKAQFSGTVDIFLWPDADIDEQSEAVHSTDRQSKFVESWQKALVNAMIQFKIDPRCMRLHRITPPLGVKSGWDLADAIDEEWSKDAILEWINEHRVPIVF